MEPSVQKWIGLAEVRSQGENSVLDSNEEGAFVNVLGLAANQRDFVERVTFAVEALKLKLVQMTDTELFSKRLLHGDVDRAIRDLATSLNPSNPIQFDVFHSFPSEKDSNE
jgi:hypothetical protein